MLGIIFFAFVDVAIVGSQLVSAAMLFKRGAGNLRVNIPVLGIFSQLFFVDGLVVLGFLVSTPVLVKGESGTFFDIGSRCRGMFHDTVTRRMMVEVNSVPREGGRPDANCERDGQGSNNEGFVLVHDLFL